MRSKILLILLFPILLLAQQQRIWQIKDYSTVERYSGSLQTAFDSSKGKTLMLTQSNYTASSVTTDLGGKSAKITSDVNSTLQFTNTASANNYFLPEGCLTIQNGNVEMDGFNVIATNAGKDPASNYRCGILIQNCDTVIIKNVSVKNAIYAGIELVNCNYVYLENVRAENNYYAGALVRGCLKTVVIGGSYSYNGLNAPTNGYGIAFTGEYPVGSVYPDNADITIMGVTANYNFRKGIDLHGGVNATITNNTVKGYGYGGIYAVDENGDDSTYKKVRDVIIADNIIENDSVWVASIGVTAAGTNPIQVGNYSSGLPNLIYSGNSFIVHHNILKNLGSPILNSIIRVFTADYGAPLESVIIDHNVIENAYPTSGNPMIDFESGSVAPKLVTISDNDITGNASYGIYVLNGDQIQIHNNNLLGSFTTPIIPTNHLGIDNYVNGDLTDTTYLPTKGGTLKGTLYTSGNIILTGTDNHIVDSVADLELRAGDGTTGKKIHLGYGVGNGSDVIFWNGSTSIKLHSYTNGNLDIAGLFRPFGGYLSADSTLGATATFGSLVFKNGLYTAGTFIDSAWTYSKFVPLTRTVNGYALSSDINLNLFDLNGMPKPLLTDPPGYLYYDPGTDSWSWQMPAPRWLGYLSSAPASPQEGDMYYDSTLGKAQVYTNSAWRNF